MSGGKDLNVWLTDVVRVNPSGVVPGLYVSENSTILYQFDPF